MTGSAARRALRAATLAAPRPSAAAQRSSGWYHYVRAGCPRRRPAAELHPLDRSSHPVYCRKCKYNLTTCAERRCPECGTRFYADDPTTFMASLEPRRFKLKLVLVASAWLCCVLAFGITILSSLVSAHWDVGLMLVRALLASLLSALLIGIPLGFIAYAVLQYRRHYLTRRWRAQSGLTSRSS